MAFQQVYVVVALLLLLSFAAVESKRRVTSVAADPDDVETATVEFSSKADLNSKMEDLQKKQAEMLDELSPKEKKKLEKAEVQLRADVEKSIRDYGEVSQMHAKSLAALGGNIYKQGRYKDVFDISKKIVELHESLDGPEGAMTAKALGNLGSVAFRLGLKKECEFAMKRALYIIISTNGDNSKEALHHRGKMLTFQVGHAETTMGMSYEDYQEQMEDEL